MWSMRQEGACLVLYCTLAITGLSLEEAVNVNWWAAHATRTIWSDVAAIGKDFHEHMHQGGWVKTAAKMAHELGSIRENPPAGQTTNTAMDITAREVVALENHWKIKNSGRIFLSILSILGGAETINKNTVFLWTIWKWVWWIYLQP